MKPVLTKCVAAGRIVSVRLLIASVVIGFFLPFFHLFAAPHAHYYNLLKGEFFDVVEMTPSAASDALRSSTLSTDDCPTPQRGALPADAPSASPISRQINLKHCETANGVLLNQICTPMMHIALAVSAIVFEDIFSDVHCPLRDVLDFAPKLSPPTS